MVEKKEGQKVERKRPSGESMERSKKSNQVFPAGAIKVEALLIRCNFWRNSVSNIVERSGRWIHYAS
jgi:hypothetical protein